MRRTLAVLLLSVACVAGLSTLGSEPAQAADSFTVDETPTEGMLTHDGAGAEFTGTITAGSEARIYLFLDGHLLTCEDYFADKLEIPDTGACWSIATIEGSTWRFSLYPTHFERYGLAFLGDHSIRFVLAAFDGYDVHLLGEQTVDTVFIESAPTASPSPSPDAVAAAPPSSPPTASGSSSELATGGASAPSVLSSLRTVSDVVTSPSNLAVAVIVTLVLIMLIGLPSTLLDLTLSENYDRIFGKATPLVARVRKALTFPALPAWAPITIGVAAACVISGFVDPGFGLNLGSVRLLASIGLAFLLEDVLGMLVIRSFLRRTEVDVDPRAEFRFGFLIIVLLAVILTRIVGFEPGLICGLVIGVKFGARLAASRDARVKLVGAGWAAAIGLVGWVVYSLLAGSDSFFAVFASETFSAVAVSALSALPISLLPLSGVDGGVVFRWNRWAWAGTYFAGLTLFFFVLMPMPFSWGEVGVPLATWVALFLGYAILATGVWAWFTFHRPAAAESGQGGVGEVLDLIEK